MVVLTLHLVRCRLHGADAILISRALGDCVSQVAKLEQGVRTLEAVCCQTARAPKQSGDGHRNEILEVTVAVDLRGMEQPPAGEESLLQPHARPALELQEDFIQEDSMHSAVGKLLHEVEEQVDAALAVMELAVCRCTDDKERLQEERTQGDVACMAMWADVDSQILQVAAYFNPYVHQCVHPHLQQHRNTRSCNGALRG